METKLTLFSSHLWFKVHVRSWITLAVNRCRARIEKAIELNETVTDKIRISTSAIDTVGFIIQVGEFWKHLDWPDPSVAYGFMIHMVQEMCDLTQFYVEKLYQAHSHSYDQDGKFMTSEHVSHMMVNLVMIMRIFLVHFLPLFFPFHQSPQLSIALNNMHHIRNFIHKLPQKLNLEPYYQWLEEEVKLGASSQDIVHRLLHNADDDFANKMTKIIDDFSGKMVPDIRKYVDRIMAAPEDVPDLKVSCNLTVSEYMCIYVHVCVNVHVVHVYVSVCE